jgi:pimeloyl-ACP methyl ester carboxylesterase
MEILDDYFKSDPYWQKKAPGLLELMSGVLDFLDRYPVTWEVKHPMNGKNQRMSFGKFDLQWITVNGLGDTQFIKALPARFYALSQGDYSWLAEAVIQDRLGRHSNLAYEMVDNASGASPASRAQIAVEAGACLLGDVINETLFDLGEVVGNPDVGDAFRTELHSEVPVLLIAGEIDGRTPVPNAEEVLKTLPNGQLIQIKGASHDLTRRGAHLPELFNLLDGFLAGEPIVQTHLDANFHFDSLGQ